MRRSRSLVLVALASCLGLLSGAAASAVGSDPGLSQQWGLRQIRAPSAWSTSVGAGVPVAVIDTGVDLDHEDLRNQLGAAVTCVGTLGDAARCAVGGDAGDDIQGHGSHVAGIAAAEANDVGVSGTAPGARIIAVRVFQTERDLQGRTQYFADSRDINAAIRWVVANVRGRTGVINLSLGDDFPVKVFDAGFEDGIEEAWSAGWVTVLAAGNEGNLAGVNGEEYGALHAVVTGATGPEGSVAAYSSPLGSAKWGLVAPGGNARSSDPDVGACSAEPERCVLSAYKGGEYGFLQGTSMAAPHVSGALALVMGAGLSAPAAVDRVLATLNRSQGCGGGCQGRLDAAAAVAGLGPAAQPSPSASPSPPPSPSGSGGTSPRRPAATAPRAPATTVAPALAEPTPAPAGAPDPVADAADVMGEEDGIDDGVGGLSVESAARLSDRGGASGNDDGTPNPAVVALAVLAAAAAATAAAITWRRRRSAPPPSPNP